jgi:hypothetical protein
LNSFTKTLNHTWITILVFSSMLLPNPTTSSLTLTSLNSSSKKLKVKNLKANSIIRMAKLDHRLFNLIINSSSSSSSSSKKRPSRIDQPSCYSKTKKKMTKTIIRTINLTDRINCLTKSLQNMKMTNYNKIKHKE